MTGNRLSHVVSLYEGRGLLERVEGDTSSAAAAWLGQARQDLSGVGTLVDGQSFRLAFNSAYDTMRHAAEAVVLKAGGRVTSAAGAHEAVFALADALAGDETPDIFAGPRAGQSRLKRHNLEYVGDNPVSVNEKDAREALQWATDAVEAAESFLSRSSAPSI